MAASIAAHAQDAPKEAASRGAATFRKVCSACHTAGQGERHRVGPNLFGVLGAPSASRPDYPYTAAFRAAALVWDERTLARFLQAPGELVPGTKMDWKVDSAQVAEDVVAFLRERR